MAARESWLRRSLRLCAGKNGWVAFGLPVETGQDGPSMLIEQIDRQIPISGSSDSVGEAKRRAETLGFRFCAVVNEEGILLGLLKEEDWQNDLAVAAEKVMDPGPTTLRPSSLFDEAAELLAKRKQNAILVTSSDGKLMGVFRR